VSTYCTSLKGGIVHPHKDILTLGGMGYVSVEFSMSVPYVGCGLELMLWNQKPIHKLFFVLERGKSQGIGVNREWVHMLH
jgi:hypothetical protein